MRPNGDSAAGTRARHPHLASMVPATCPLTRRGRNLLATATHPRPHSLRAPLPRTKRTRLLAPPASVQHHLRLRPLPPTGPPPSHLRPARVVRTPCTPTPATTSIARQASAPPSNTRNGLLLTASTAA